MLEVSELTKDYGNFRALKGVCFRADKGEILGLLGPNGAGKSTTMNIITGFLPKSGGYVRLDGVDISSSPAAFKKRIGYLPELNPLPVHMTVSEFLEFSSDLKQVEKSAQKEGMDRAAELAGLKEVRGRLIRNLSKGYRQRVGIAQALIGWPELLILDEPTVGLDPKQMIEVRELIQGLGRSHTVIFSSHILSEVSAVCDRVAILAGGSVVAQDTPEKLAAGLGSMTRLRLSVAGSGRDALPHIRNTQGVLSASLVGERPGRADFALDIGEAETVCQKLFLAFAEAGIPIIEMTPVSLSLEEVFLRLITEKSAEGSHESHTEA